MCHTPVYNYSRKEISKTMSDRILTLLDSIVELLSEITDIIREQTQIKLAAQAETIQTQIQMQQANMQTFSEIVSPKDAESSNRQDRPLVQRPVIRGSYGTSKLTLDR